MLGVISVLLSEERERSDILLFCFRLALEEPPVLFRPLLDRLEALDGVCVGEGLAGVAGDLIELTERGPDEAELTERGDLSEHVEPTDAGDFALRLKRGDLGDNNVRPVL